ncbi:MAG TPA: response regulator transcription factor [Vicinamibacterales bacterium]|nr:response regulator transcription factor [Vicinamibacterales bacterium]
MRVILVGAGRDRDRLRPQLRDAGLTIVGEYDREPDDRPAGIDAVILAGPEGAAAPVLSRGGLTRDAIEEALTPREQDVLALVAEGLPNKAIAAALGISDQTVKFHVAAIIGKLGAANRTDAVRRAVRRGLVTL